MYVLLVRLTKLLLKYENVVMLLKAVRVEGSAIINLSVTQMDVAKVYSATERCDYDESAADCFVKNTAQPS